MIDSIQELIEELSQDIQRSVAVDDPNLRLLGHSTHFEDADAARVDSLVGREVMGPLRDYVMSQGARTWREITVLPPKPELGIEHERTCIPLRSRYELLGFLWIINANSLTEAQMGTARVVGERIRTVLAHREQSRADAEVERESLLRALLSSDPADRQHAVEDIAKLDLFSGFTHFVAIAVSTRIASESDQGERPAELIRQALLHATQGRRRESYAYAEIGDTTALLLAYRAPTPADDATLIATAIHSELRRLDTTLSEFTVIGIGTEQTTLEEVVLSYHQGVAAIRFAVNLKETVVTWVDHPVDAVLSTLLSSEYQLALIPEPIRSLRKTQSATTLQILETFLEHAGNVNAAAEVLHLHRTTVYYRLNKFQERSGLDLDHGPTRLLLHLWLRTPNYAAPIEG